MTRSNRCWFTKPAFGRDNHSAPEGFGLPGRETKTMKLNTMIAQLLSQCFELPMTRNHRAPRRKAAIPAATGPMDLLRGKQTTVILDVENLTASAHNLGREFDYCALHAAMKAAGSRPEVHAVFSRQSCDERWVSYFRDCDIIPHPRQVKRIVTHNGVRETMNSDVAIAVICGLVAARQPDELVLGTGDGQLALDIVEVLLAQMPRLRIVTLGVPGSVSTALRAEPRIHGHLAAGADCLKPADEFWIEPDFRNHNRNGGGRCSRR